MGDVEGEAAPILPPSSLEPRPAAAPRSALGRKASLVLGSSALGSLMGAVSLLILGRFDKAALGFYVVAASALGIVQLLADLGFGAAHIHFVGKGTDASRALGVYARVRAALTLAAALVLLAGGWVWFGLLGKTVTDATTLPIVGVVLATQVVSLVRTVFVDTWIGLERFNRSEATKTVDTLLVLLALALLWLGVASVKGQPTPFDGLGGAIAGWLRLGQGSGIAEIGLAIALAYLAAKVLSLVPIVVLWSRAPIGIGPWDRDLAGKYARFAIPVALGAGAAMLVPWTDKVMLGIFGTSADTAQFEIMLRFASLGGLVATALAVPLLPRFSLMLREGQHEEAGRTMRRVERFLLLVAVPVAAVLVVLPEQVLHILASDQYVPDANAMRLLALSALVGTAMVPTVTKVMGGGHSKAAMTGTLVTVGTNGILNLWLIPRWGAGLGVMGAAISALVSSLLSATYIRLVLRRKFGIPAFDLLFAKMALAGLAPAAFCLAALRWMPEVAFTRFWMMALWSLGAFAVFLLAAAALRLVRRDDLRTVWNVANPKALFRELRGRQD